MTARTPRSASDDSLPAALSPFCGDQNEEPTPLLAQCKQLCPGELDEGAIKEATITEVREKRKKRGDNFPMHKDLRSLLDDPEQDVTGLFAAQEEV